MTDTEHNGSHTKRTSNWNPGLSATRWELYCSYH